MRYLFGFLCVCAVGVVPLVGCGETAGTGGSGGDGGSAGTGGTCQPQTGCPEDGDLCTHDECIDGACVYVSKDCDDFNDCTAEMCDPTDGECSATPIADGTACAGGTCEGGACALSGTVLPCTEQGIRNAIAAGGGPYTFDCEGSTPVVTEAEIVIDNDVILDGEGNLTVDGGGEHADIFEDHRVFFVPEGVTAELRGFTVTGGWLKQDPKAALKGAGISNGGSLTVTNSTVSENTAFRGGGIYNDEGTLTLTNSTVSENTALLAGGIGNRGTLTLTNSTVSGNTAAAEGGGIDNSGGTLTLISSTVSGNTAVRGDGIYHAGGTLTLTNSLVDDGCVGLITSNGYNIESPGDTCGFDPDGTDQVNVSSDDLKLGPLQDNGGPTETHALLPGSVAIDVIPADMCEVDEDQRGVARPQGDACDVGAVEMEVTP